MAWKVGQWPDSKVIGHDGRATGQGSALRVYPEGDLIVVLLVNTFPNGVLLAHFLFEGVHGTVLGITTPAMLTASLTPSPFDADRYVGVHQPRDATVTVGTDQSAGLRLTTGLLGQPSPGTNVILTGEWAVRDDDLGGLSVHVAATVGAVAEAGEVMVSHVVPVLVAGSGITFVERGSHVLKGQPGAWGTVRGRPVEAHPIRSAASLSDLYTNHMIGYGINCGYTVAHGSAHSAS